MSHQEEGIGKSTKNKIKNIKGHQVQSLLSKLRIILPHFDGANDSDDENNADPLSLPLRELLTPKHYTPGEVDNGKGGRHVLQESSILNHLKRINALPPPLSNDDDKEEGEKWIAVELGAGTAKLSERLQRITNCKMHHVLVDRVTMKKCRDGIMRSRYRHSGSKVNKEGEEERVKRIVGDIASFELTPYLCDDDNSSSSNDDKNHCVCLSKHLCGPACDLALTSLRRAATAKKNSSQQQQQQEQAVVKPLPPIAVATCCHYLCTWSAFTKTSQEFWMNCGLNEDEFNTACAVSQWYSLKDGGGGGGSCGSTSYKRKRNGVKKCNEDDTKFNQDQKEDRSCVEKKKSFTSSSSMQDSKDVNTSPSPPSMSKYPHSDVLPDLMSIAKKAGMALSSSSSSSLSSTANTEMMSSEEFEQNFSKQSKAQLGYSVKKMLDLARAAELQALGYNYVEVVRYTSCSIENRLIIGYNHASHDGDGGDS